jgi:hypothetical protein
VSVADDSSQDEGRHIPADIRRQVLLEAGHACAIPTCQFPAIEFAHIVPFAEVKSHDPTNIIALCPNHHHQYDQKKSIDRKSMRAYKLKLQFLNKRYTKYELRLLAQLAEKAYVLAAGEIQVLGLLKDGLIENANTFMTQSILVSDKVSGQKVFEDVFVVHFAATLTAKGRQFVDTWKAQSEDLLAAL